ncbi:hypothetical protein HELRODRAFT_170590 [Helobdella robusta]|uniref:SUEL-type lectin domain-containing protein n=1 Tax=Helobdella robusta TaxID=6412 RepID=T1F378_HELRO|nr:hypothetical protein HELRODRAFT_170590 [Helobdella robusta]ESO07262.1 hypothetical protein HELRODRAFT_170590 [Helobdella robusta]
MSSTISTVTKIELKHLVDEKRSEILSEGNKGIRSSTNQMKVVLIKGASYGRMHKGRCVETHTNCSIDATAYMDSLCSAKTSCEVYVAEAALHRLGVCSKEFSSYLEADYMCVLATLPTDCSKDDHLVVHAHQDGYLLPPYWTGSSEASLKTGNTSTGSCYNIKVKVEKGQKLQVTLLNFNIFQQQQQQFKEISCPIVATITENFKMTDNEINNNDDDDINNNIVKQQQQQHQTSLANPNRDTKNKIDNKTVRLSSTTTNNNNFASVQISLCSRAEREVTWYTSVSHDVTISYTSAMSFKTLPNFILKYKVLGCKHPTLPAKSWMTSDGHVATIRCNETKQQWSMNCVLNKWQGEMMNCSEPFSKQNNGQKLVRTNEENFPYGEY